MIFNIQKFNKELKALEIVKDFQPDLLHPLVHEQIKQRVLQAISQTSGQTSSQPVRNFSFWQKNKFAFTRFVLPAVFGLSLTGGTAFASNYALPGDLLYPVKKVKEITREVLTFSQQSKALLHADHAQTRLNELNQLESLAAQNSNVSTNTIQKLEQIHKKAEDDAAIEIKHDIIILTQTKTQLETAGSTPIIQRLDHEINEIKQKAKEKNLEIEDTQTEPQTHNKNPKKSSQNSSESQTQENNNQQER